MAKRKVKIKTAARTVQRPTVPMAEFQKLQVKVDLLTNGLAEMRLKHESQALWIEALLKRTYRQPWWKLWLK